MKYNAEAGFTPAFFIEVMKMADIPVWEKSNLTIEEAAEYFSIPPEDLTNITSDSDCQPYLLQISGRKLIKRRPFEDYLSTRYSVGACDSSDFVVQSSDQHLDNYINTLGCVPFQQGAEEMATKINRTVTVNGEQKWIHANTEQEYCDKIAKILGQLLEPATSKHDFAAYAQNWFDLYSKPNIELATATTYQRQLRLYLIPAFDGMAIEDITTDDVQKLFNGMTGAKATKQKAKQVLNMVFETALEDGLIQRNPLKSKRLKITGASTQFTKEYSIEQMRFLIQNLGQIKNPVDRAYLALQALHPLRLEEVLGLKWEDVDTDNMILHIRRAVTHPDRNRPEVKATKTDASTRDIGLSGIAAGHLTRGKDDEFVFGGVKPFSYQQVKRMCERIQKDTGFEEKVTPIRFRTTVLTDIYDQTKDVKAAQMAAGHTTSAMTLKHYVKGRGGATQTATAIDLAYGS